MIALVTGGSGSGKSAWAEALAMRLCPGEKYYIATMRAWGAEGEARVARHRALRAGKRFVTVERPLDLAGLARDPAWTGRTALLECTSNLLANEMFDPEGAGENAVPAILDGFRVLAGRTAELVIVTNEIFSDGVAYDADTARYIACLGEINRALADLADCAVEVVCGIPVALKGGERLAAVRPRPGMV